MAAERKRPQPSTSEHVSQLLEAERSADQDAPRPATAPSRTASSSSVSGVTKPVTKLLWSAFGGWTPGLVDFLDRVLMPVSGAGSERHFLVMSSMHERFLGLFLEHARTEQLERPVNQPPAQEAAASASDDAADPEKHLALPVRESDHELLEGAKRVYKKGVTSFASSHRLRVRYVPNTGSPIDRDYETRRGIVALCRTLSDQRLEGRRKLQELPHLVFRALLDSGNVCDPKQPALSGLSARREYIESLLVRELRSDPFIAFQFKCPFIYETLLLETDVRIKDAQLESSKRLKGIFEKRERELMELTRPPPPQASAPLDIERLTLAVYLYYRLLINGLDLTVAQSETCFCLVMYLLEECIGRSRNAPGIALINQSTLESAKKDIAGNPFLFERVVRVADDAVRFVLAKTGSAPAAPQPSRMLGTIYDSALHLKLSLHRIKKVDCAREEDSAVLRRMFFWHRNLQVTWSIVEADFEKRFSPLRARHARLFAEEYPQCCAFMLDPSVSVETFLRSMRHLNLMHQMFRFVEVAYTDESVRYVKNANDFAPAYKSRFSPRDDADPAESDASEQLHNDYITEAVAAQAGLRDASYFCVLTDGGSRSYVLFSDPRAHQRFCNFSISEALTTPRQEKLMPMYPFLLRQYAGVFGSYEWCPTDLSRLAAHQRVYRRVLESDFGAKGPEGSEDARGHARPNLVPENIDQVNLCDDHENLALFVNTVFFQLCRYTVSEVKRLQETLHSGVLDGCERDFRTYRYFHRICSTLDDYMEDYPYFVSEQGQSGRPTVDAKTRAGTLPRDKHRPPHVLDDLKLFAERGRGLVYTCEVLLCFLCLGAVHTLKGDTIFRLKKYLDGLTGDRAGRHDALSHYLDMLKSQEANKEAISEGSQCCVQLTFDRQLAYDRNLFVRAKGTFDDLIFPERFGLNVSARREMARINSLVYRFVVDEHLSIDLRGQVLFDLDHQKQRVKKAVYYRQIRDPRGGLDRHINANSRTSTPSATPPASPFLASASPAPLAAVFKEPAAPGSRKRPIEEASQEAAAAGSQDDDASSDTSALQHVRQVFSPRARPNSESERFGQVARQTNASVEQMVFTELPIKKLARDKLPEYDVYRGLHSIRSSGPLKSLCSAYASHVCYDLERDMPKSIVTRGLEAAVQAYERKYTELKARVKDAAARLPDAHPDKKSLIKMLEPPKAGQALPQAGEDAERALEREHQRIIALVAKISPPALVNGMYCGRGRDGETRAMREAVNSVMANAGFEVEPEPQELVAMRRRGYGPRLPIAYAPGSYRNITTVMGSLKHVGRWRYEVCAEFRLAAAVAERGAGTEVVPEYQTCSFEPMSRLLRALEWMLYHRTQATERSEQNARKPDDELNSPRFWSIEADRFVWYQLNSKLPIDFTPMTKEEVEASRLEERDDAMEARASHNGAEEESSASSEGDEEEARARAESDANSESSLSSSSSISNSTSTNHAALPEDSAVVCGELSDVADHFWSVSSPLAFLDNSGWTLRISSQEKEEEAAVERGGPSVSEGLSQILDEYSRTLSSLVSMAGQFPRDPIAALPTVVFIRELVESAKKTYKGPAPQEILEEAEASEKAEAAPAPAPAPQQQQPHLPAKRARSPPPPSTPSKVPAYNAEPWLDMQNFHIETHGSNLPRHVASAGSSDGMTWPAALYVGERSAAATREREQQQQQQRQRQRPVSSGGGRR